MRYLIAILFVGCAGSQPMRLPAEAPPPVAVEPSSTPAAAPAAPTTIAPMSEAQVIEKSHVWHDAWDQFDAAKWSEPLGSTFILYEDARFFTRDMLVAGLKARADKQLPHRTRTWDDEHVYLGESIAIFIGHAIENLPANGTNAASTIDGYYTVVWTPENNRWVIGHWQWSRAGIEAERDVWNDMYRRGTSFNQKPNQLLVDTIKGKKPGTALDIGMGQGRNAIYLASQGWKTTGVDIATEGLRIAREEAARRKLKNFTAVEGDFDKYDFGKAKWDLVTMIYEGTDHKMVERIQAALKPGGLFISEYFHADSDVAKTGAGGWKTGELAELFKDGWKILRDEVVEDTADWGQRKTKLVRFVAQKR